ncbi:metal ABC transporter permease [Mucisphaera calidilacus]|uniref:Manganese transport system membrane protein MntB n=1 Tax=Mucisphaera calidilacus TaxID=2527982 RepID=A0A518C010_9BACT|nr:iron chelate uptake ABC transporter family permease subunit [Mucisphaera calidilacus]QDU72558.1 Manganese transport system membrane protein MntB [Mucisphaera calidilacus]
MLAQLTSELPTLDDALRVLLARDYNTRLVILSTALLGMAAGVTGSFLLLRKRSLMGDALSHATLPGIALAFALAVLAGADGKNLPTLLLGATLTGILGVAAVKLIRQTTRLRDDAAMGIVLSVFFGIGVAILAMVQDLPNTSAAGLESFIYGKTASMVLTDFTLIASAAAAIVAACLMLLKEFTLLAFDENYAATQGWPTHALDALMLALVVLVTVIGLQAVGLILIIALLITPAAAARFWTHDLRHMLLIAAAIGAASGWIGAALSALVPNLPAGAVIVLVTALFFATSMLFGPARGVLTRWLRHHRLQRKIGRQHLLRAAFELLEARRHPESSHIPNTPVRIADLLARRSWTPGKLRGFIRTARAEDHIESVDGRQLRLSEAGFGEAARITRNHRLWELFLIRHADIAPSHVDRDADMVEHVLDPDIVRQLEAELEAADHTLDVPPSPHRLTPGAAP